MDRSPPKSVEHVRLATAAIIVYKGVTGKNLEYSDVEEMNDILQRLAHALSNTADIYTTDAQSGIFKKIETTDLVLGAFQRGATILRTSSAEYGNLTMQRKDLDPAIAILKHAGITFTAAASTASAKRPAS